MRYIQAFIEPGAKIDEFLLSIESHQEKGCAPKAFTENSIASIYILLASVETKENVDRPDWQFKSLLELGFIHDFPSCTFFNPVLPLTHRI